jgi:hypothetical protein
MAVGNALRSGIPLPVLAGTEIRLREYFLETKNLDALIAGVFDVGDMSLDHDVPKLVGIH